MLLRSAARKEAAKVAREPPKSTPKIAQKVAQKDDVISLNRSLKRKKEGVYILNDTYYTIYEGKITYFNSSQVPKNLTVGFLQRLRLCSNSELLLEWHTEVSSRDEDGYVFIVSNRNDIDGYAKVVSADEDRLSVEVFTETISERENGTRTWDTEYTELCYIQWKYLDSFQTVYDLPSWTDSEPEESDESDEYSGSSEDSE